MENNKQQKEQQQEQKVVPEQVQEQLIKKQKPKWIVPAIVIVGIIILGVGAWVVYNYWFKPALPEEQSTEEQSGEKPQNEAVNTRKEPSNIDDLANDIETWTLGDFKLTKEKTGRWDAYRFYVTVDKNPSGIMSLYDSSGNVESTVKHCDLLYGNGDLTKGTISIGGMGIGDLYRTYGNVEVYFGSTGRGFDGPSYFWCNSSKTVLIMVSVSGKLVDKYFQFYGLTQKEMTSLERDTKRKSDIEIIGFILEEYIEENPLPVTSEVIKIDDPNTALNQKLNKFIKENKVFSSFLENSLPRDPLSPQNYYGLRVVNEKGINFILTAKLENINDPECVIENHICLYKNTR